MGRRLAPWVGGVLAVLLVVGGTFWIAQRDSAFHAPDLDPLPVAKDGYRWVSWRNVAVQVPEEWGYGYDPGDQWCVDDRDRQTDGFVVYRQTHAASTAVGCLEQSEAPEMFGPEPPDRWHDHLTFQDPEKDAGQSATYHGWTLTSRVVDGVEVRLLSDDPQRTQGILASARPFDIDENGCAPTSEIQAEKFQRPSPGYDVGRIDSVDSISVCQYQRADMRPGQPALMASRRITGPAAADLLRGLQAAPGTGGPDLPRQCVHDMYGDDAVELLLHHGGNHTRSTSITTGASATVSTTA